MNCNTLPNPLMHITKGTDQYNYCVLIPTYNNAKTLNRVIDGVLEHTHNIIIVNDGATDETATILQAYPKLQQIHLQKNQGKGNALQIGFKKALDLGYEYAITIDSDGQHYPKDIPVFIDALKKEPSANVLLIGSRNMNQESVPGTSSFGNKFSNFWFKFETGIKLTDTQCGYRLYPLKQIEKLNLFTPKFEFEIEVIVKAAWSGTVVKNVPINILYDENERVTHFRKVPDFTRISILNTWFVLVALFYIKPRNFFRKLKQKGLKKFISEDVLQSNDSPKKKALSISLGLFVGLSPFWGFQTAIVLGAAVLLKLNKAIAFAFSNVSFPPFIPFIVYASVLLGSWFTGEQVFVTTDSIAENIFAFKGLKTYLIGSLLLATISAVVIGIFSFIILSILAKRKIPVKNG